MVWDVGHQAYPRKLITGRFNDFHTLRQKDGVAGYLKRCESTSIISALVTPHQHFGGAWHGHRPRSSRAKPQLCGGDW